MDILKFRNCEIWVNGAMDMYGLVLSSMGIWLVSSNFLYRDRTWLTNSTDSSIWESNRLDPSVYRLCPTNTRKDVSYCSSVRWVTIIQYRQFPPDPRSVDARVCHPESELHCNGLYIVHWWRCAGRRQQVKAQREQRSISRLHGRIRQVHAGDEAVFRTLWRSIQRARIEAT